MRMYRQIGVAYTIPPKAMELALAMLRVDGIVAASVCTYSFKDDGMMDGEVLITLTATEAFHNWCSPTEG